MQGDNQNPPIDQNIPSSEQITQIEKSKFTNKKLLLIGIIIFVLILVLVPSIFLFSKNFSKNTKTQISNPKPAAPQTQSSKSLNNLLNEEDINIKGVLVPYIPHFNDLKDTDLPSTFDTRFFTKYKNNYLIAGTGGIQEYDLDKKKLVRVQDKRIFDCNHSFAIIGDYLYAACNGSYSEGKGFISKGRSIYKIDLKTGNAIKRYYEYEIVPNPENVNVQNSFPDFTNITITSLGQMIWGGVQNGVFSIDTNTDAVKYYTDEKLGFVGNCSWMNIWGNEKYVWTIPQVSDCSTGVSVFNPLANKWTIYSSDDIQKITGPIINFEINTIEASPDTMYLTGTSGIGYVDKYIIKYNSVSNNWDLLLKFNNDSSSPSSDFKQYYPDAYAKVDKQNETISAIGSYNSISSLINGKYYITGDKIYVLRKNSFPEVFLPTDLSPYSLKNIYVTKDEKYIIAQNAGVGMIYTADILLINLTNNKYDSLLKGDLAYDKLSEENKKKFDYNVEYDFEEQDNKVLVKDKLGNKLFTVDLVNRSLSF